MAWSGRPTLNMANSMLIREGNTVNALMAMLSSCPQPCFRGFDERLSGAELKRPLDVDGLGDDHLTDHQEHSHHAEKKRRLTVEQVRRLEKSFEVENKLEPERKLQLATELGLQHRQVAVWFQNRRARWKTKQLEQDYDILKTEYESLLQEKQKLQAEVISLTDQLIAKEAKTKSIRGDDFGSSESSSQQGSDSDIETSLEAENQAAVSCKLHASSPMPEKGLNCIFKPSIEDCSPKSDGYNSEVLDVGSPINPVDTGLDQQQSTGIAAEQHIMAGHALGIFTYHPMGEGAYGTVYSNTQMYEQIACKLEDGLFYENHVYHDCNTSDEAAFPAWWYCP